MPCNSDYMQPSEQEHHMRLTAQLMLYVMDSTALPKTFGPNFRKAVRKTVDEAYPQTDFTKQLCEALRGLNKERLDAVVYNARSSMARKLADWWEEHQKADKARVKEEDRLKRLAKARKSAIRKLSAEEREALGIEEK